MYVSQNELQEQRESAVFQKRIWVRTNWLCNQHCMFCLDADIQDGTLRPYDDVCAEIKQGRESGGERLILSGGEASLHPNFVDFIRYGRELGYEWIQTVTNGQKYADTDFTKAVIEAGLNEVTFSIHGHTPALHDRLTQRKGAFVWALRGLTNLWRAGSVVINMDIVINDLNYRYLPEIVDNYAKIGIREFDLLFIVPFGRAMKPGFKEHLLIDDVHKVTPYIKKTLKLADKYNLFIWTNRLPPPMLEGLERYIQDPHKLEDEANGRRIEFERLIKHGIPPDCAGEACRYCFIENMCTTLAETAEKVRNRNMEHLELEINNGQIEVSDLDICKEFLTNAKQLKLTAENCESLAVLSEIEKLPHLIIDLNEYSGFPDSLPKPLQQQVKGVVLHDEKAINDWLEVFSEIQAIIDLHPGTRLALKQLSKSKNSDWSKVTVQIVNHERLSQAMERDVAIKESLRSFTTPGRISNIPQCLAGKHKIVERVNWFPLRLINREGLLDLDQFVDYYIINDYYTKSYRCRDCRFDSECRGAHINRVRHQGYTIFSPK